MPTPTPTPTPSGAGPGPIRERGITVRPFPPNRRLVTAARAGRRIAPMHGLFDVDITAARHLLAENDPPLSLTAFVVALVGRAAPRWLPPRGGFRACTGRCSR